MKLRKNPEMNASSESRSLMSNQTLTSFPTSTYFNVKGAGRPSEARRAAIIIADESPYNLSAETHQERYQWDHQSQSLSGTI